MLIKTCEKTTTNFPGLYAINIIKNAYLGFSCFLRQWASPVPEEKKQIEVSNSEVVRQAHNQYNNSLVSL